MGHNTAVMTPEDVNWLITHLQGVVAINSAVWAGRGITLVQLTALHLIGALAPVTLIDLAQALGTKSPATSVTFSINSICHMIGQRPFATRDKATNL